MVEHLDTQLNEPTNQNLIQVLKLSSHQIRKLLNFKTLGTSVIFQCPLPHSYETFRLYPKIDVNSREGRNIELVPKV